MKQFVGFHRSTSIDYKSSVVYKPNKVEIDYKVRDKVEAAYKSHLAEGKLEKLTNSRTESVYKLLIDEKPYVLKMANFFDDRDIYKELMIEHDIYEYLSNLRK